MDVKTLGTPGLLPMPTRPGELPGASSAPGAGAGEGPGFGAILKDSLRQVNSLQHQADGAIQSLTTGGPVTLHDTMLAVQQAELSFKLMMNVRNKLVEAYQEVLRMTV
jgi:flagellar hook-basal body complex protein FliE